MQNLIEIISIVKNINLKSSDFLTADGTKETQTKIFYNKILEGEFRTDEEAANYFFNSSTNTSKYKNLKRYLREKLLNTLFFIKPTKNYGDYNRAYLYWCKNLFAAKILMNFGARNSGIDLCQKVFKKALQVELTEFIISSSRYLRLHYGTRIGNEEKYDYFNEIFRQYYEIAFAENMAEEFYIKLMIPYSTSQAVKEETYDNTVRFYNLLRPYLEKFSSPVLHFYAYYIKIMGALVINDYHSLVAHCREGIHFFKNKEYKYITPLRVFYHNLLIGYTQLKDFKNGEKVAEKASSLISAGTHSWYIHQELLLILALHAKEYNESTKILNRTINSRKFNAQSSTLRERWFINSAYVHFLASIGKIDDTSIVKGTFRLGKFLNSIPNYSKDKRGLNIPILIIQILFMITRKKYDEAIDRFEAIKKYSSRYIRKGENFRSHCFLNMLLQIPACSFHKSGVIRKTQSWYNKLKSTPLEIANQPNEVEIIPYEDLWEYIVDSLETRFY